MPAELREFVIPGLATVTIDSRNNYEPLLKIMLDPAYRGDLNDLERQNPYPAGVYLECDSTSCINDPLLAKFMEVASHWDYDFNGTFDADELVNAIEAAMWRSRDTPDEFHRPSHGWYTGTLMKLMPPAPKRHIVFSFGELRERFRWYHYVLAIPTIAAVIGIIQLQIHYLPVLKYNVITGLMAIGETLGLNKWVTFGIVMVALQFLLGRRNKHNSSSTSRSPHTYGFFNKAAVYEEQAFREGSESWNPWQRFMSCFVFGAIHMTNIIYPLATILPLAMGGAVFMAVYLRVYRRTKFRRSAVLASALVHRVYNRIAITAFLISLVLILGWAVLSMFGVAALLVAATVYPVQFKLRSRRTTSAPVPEPALD